MKFFIILILLLSVAIVHAAESGMIAEEPFALFRKVNGKVQKAIFPAETRILLSEDIRGGWYRVKVERNGTWVTGHIHKNQVSSFSRLASSNGKTQRAPAQGENLELRAHKPIQSTTTEPTRAAIGAAGLISQNQQPSQVVSSSSGQSFSISELSGTSSSATIFLDSEINASWVFRSFVSLRQINLAGEASLVLSQGQSQASPIQRKLQSLGVGGSVRKYFTSKISAGLGLEVAKIVSEEMIVDRAPGIRAEREDLSFFYVPTITTSYDFFLTPQLTLMPELRAGAMLGEIKPVFYGEVALALAYRL